ncbi:hypothetical protein Dsin_032988 [Dipteronia sinensis]|uniref:Uncharacterized protein n=1 Tax=Dipteronia sinensis TaxID=43782 RepID=A0AAD9Z4J1_9ROSI|nr:hypothetical protein Dsin_032988 [Dipteronia sinensis]
MPVRIVNSWNTILSGYLKQGDFAKALTSKMPGNLKVTSPVSSINASGNHGMIALRNGYQSWWKFSNTIGLTALSTWKYAVRRSTGGACIADELQTDFGCTGSHYWGFETAWSRS